MKSLKLGEWVLEEVALAKMRLGPNVRKNIRPEDLAQLVASLKEDGQFHPLILTPDFEVTDGGRRYRAAQLAGIERLWAIITSARLEAAELTAAQLAMDLHKESISPIDLYEAFVQLLEAHGWTQKELAARLKVAESTVTKVMAVGKAAPAIRAAVQEGRFGLRRGYEIARADASRQNELMESTRRDSAPARAEGTPRLFKLRMPLPSGAVVTIEAESDSIEALTEAHVAAGKLIRKAREQGWDAKALAAASATKPK